MKKIKLIIIVAALCCLHISCNESSWLKEKPLDFYTAENSYQTTAQFKQSLNYLYDVVRNLHWKLGDQHVTMWCGDIGYGATDPDNKFNNFKTFLTPYTYVAGSFWTPSFAGIANANIILNRLTLTEQVSEDDKKSIRGEALFFRAYYYNLLANLFGGVPLILEEPTDSRRDYVRASREEVYDRVRMDLEEAISLLKDIAEAPDGAVNKQAAQHLLAEVYISLKNYPKAIEAASAVINHPAMGLMKERFGSRKNHEGDPYWDLFQADNQNRSSGNTETIWALQYEYKNSGSSYSYEMPRWLLPFYTGLQVESAKNDGSKVLAFTTFTEEKGGRGIGCIRPTEHFLSEIWKKDGDKDYRNSSYMIIRDFRIDNKEAKGFGEWVVKDGWLESGQEVRNFYPFVMKFSRVGGLPDDNYAKNPDGSYATTALGEHELIYQWGSLSANTSMKDEYMYRLAGTYLLRAEAYLANGQSDKAAEDLNEIRARSNATSIQVSDVNLDFILDEQLRELYFEDFRLPTLCRLNKTVERSKAYNPYGHNVGDYQNLLPIPYSEIEKNIYEKLEQNPGYEGF